MSENTRPPERPVLNERTLDTKARQLPTSTEPDTPRTDAVLSSDHYAKDILELARTLERELRAYAKDAEMWERCARYWYKRRPPMEQSSVIDAVLSRKAD